MTVGDSLSLVMPPRLHKLSDFVGAERSSSRPAEKSYSDVGDVQRVALNLADMCRRPAKALEVVRMTSHGHVPSPCSQARLRHTVHICKLTLAALDVL
jgi:hypothetical protein